MLRADGVSADRDGLEERDGAAEPRADDPLSAGRILFPLDGAGAELPREGALLPARGVDERGAGAGLLLRDGEDELREGADELRDGDALREGALREGAALRDGLEDPREAPPPPRLAPARCAST